MNNITVTYRDGRTRHLDHVFIRGSKVRFMVCPLLATSYLACPLPHLVCPSQLPDHAKGGGNKFRSPVKPRVHVQPLRNNPTLMQPCTLELPQQAL